MISRGALYSLDKLSRRLRLQCNAEREIPLVILPQVVELNAEYLKNLVRLLCQQGKWLASPGVDSPCISKKCRAASNTR